MKQNYNRKSFLKSSLLMVKKIISQAEVLVSVAKKS